MTSLPDRHQFIKDTLLEQSKINGKKMKDLKVLSVDPFFIGSARDYENATWAATLWDRMMATRGQPLHLRGFHYWIQSQAIVKPDGTIYAQGADPAKDWRYLLECAQMARYLHIGEWQNLVDLKHPNPLDYDFYLFGAGIAEAGDVDIQKTMQEKFDGLVNSFLEEVLLHAPRYNRDGYQTYHCEVWCEKNSMGFVIEPACQLYGACYQPLVGQASVEKVDLAAERALKAAEMGKRVRIFYISDWDRYGWSMVSAVARKLEFMVYDRKVDLRLTRLALNDDQIAKYNLPKAPKHGEAVVELDALEAIHPGVLGQIIRDAMSPYYDRERPGVVDQENLRMAEEARKIVEEKLRQQLTQIFSTINLDGVTGDFNLKSVVRADFTPPQPGHEAQEDDQVWMLDTKRGFWEQLERYQVYKDERVEEPTE